MKIGFWSVFAVVLGAQVGSGMLMLPATLAPFGLLSIWGWIIACCGAMSLAFIFSKLCTIMPKTGGPHAYVKMAFGDTASFFTGWTYWLVSWISTAIVVISCVAYLSPFIEQYGDDAFLYGEFIILAIITYINCVSINLSSKIELVLTILKFAPLIIIPILTIPHFQISNFSVSKALNDLPMTDIVSQASLLAFWGFIGVECATAPAGSVKNPERNIPLAILLGTTCAALLYLFNCLGIMGTIPGETLANVNAPYVEFAKIAFSGRSDYIMGIIGFIICLGTLNAWTLTSGQIALGLAQDRLLPKLFAITNKAHAPYFNIIISSLGISIILLLTRQQSIAKQVIQIIDFSVISFLFVYLISAISLLKITYRERNISHMLLSVFASVFCIWVISNSDLVSVCTASAFTLSGILVYPFIKKDNVYQK